ncbi:TPA: hypothetical protein N0F65_008725 [Lagenidium giganteum]|uniref:Uncharacterized protein n=1 Tax=Lagenidium giganteum TaxID=4803 RepID=A0AAV2YQY8_9STRA|nr:TPA: hypothetical protein N0F65_008725 [Lagenidium giganteum]
MAYPISLYRPINTFGRSRRSLCQVYLTLVKQLFGEWKSHMYLHQRLLSQRAQA